MAAGDRLTPGAVYVIPITNDEQRQAATLLGDFPFDDNGLPLVTDAGDEAFQKSRDRAILRLRHDLYPMLDASFDALNPNDGDADIDARVKDALGMLCKHPKEPIRFAAEKLKKKQDRSIKTHPLGGLVLIGRSRLHRFDSTFVEPEESWDSISDRPYALNRHCRDVAALAKKIAEAAGLQPHALPLELAGLLHDAGKADPRFQAWLHAGNRRRADLYPFLLAKSIAPMPAAADRTLARQRSGYPDSGRHELVSVRLAERPDALPSNLSPSERNLVLHLIASHHGYCRPFAPIITDEFPVTVAFEHLGRMLSASSATELECLDSGVAERFWTLTRRYGWWGLPYLESLLRLADWASGEPKESVPTPSQMPAVLAGVAS